jgi:hypothetical protein
LFSSYDVINSFIKWKHPIFFLDSDSPFNCLNDSVKILLPYGISGLFKILPTRGICNLRGLARVGYYLEWVVLNNPRMPYNVLSNIPKFLDNDIIDEILLPMGYGR